MKLKSLLSFLLSLLMISAFCQKQVYDFTFSALYNTSNIQLDSVKIMNHTQNSETTIYWPDTSISLDISIGDTLLYVGGNLVVGKQEWAGVKQRFVDMGFDRVYPPGTLPNITIGDLRSDLRL